jgi:hypothetical protein
VINYLAKIVTRAKGTYDSESIKPVIRSWPIDNSGNNSNPFKEEIAPACVFPDHEDRPLPEDRSLAQVKSENPAISLPPFDEKNKPVNIGQPIFNHPDRIIHPSSFPFGESVTPLSPSIEVNRSINIDQPVADQKPEGIDTPATKKTGQAEEVVLDPESFSPPRNPSFETGLIHKQPLIQDLENKIVIKKQHVPEQDKTHLGPIQQSTSEPKVPELSPTGSKENKRLDRKSAPVQMLRPPAPIDSTPAPIQKTSKREPRLVIGRLKVEVVTPPSAVKKQPQIRKISRSFKSQQRHNKINSGSKLRFGLGQI